MMKRVVLSILALLPWHIAAAQDTRTVNGADNVTIALEDKLAAEVSAGIDHIGAGRPADALRAFEAVIAAYEAEHSGRHFMCAESLEQATIVSVLAMATEAYDGDVTILGTNWCTALFGKAFALIDLNRSDEAEPPLLRAIAMAPLKAHYVNELAELYKSRKQWRLSHDTFERAFQTGQFPGADTPPHVFARSLRGMGFAKIELGELDEAKALFHRSQEYEPNSPAARTELEYIADLEAKQS